MTAKHAFVWLLLLTLALVALTVAVHYVPLPLPVTLPRTTPVVVPSPDEPTLVASAAAPAGGLSRPAAPA